MSEKQPYESLPLVEAYYDNEWVKAYHLKIHSEFNNHVVVFLNGDTSWVKEIREIKEPTKRPMTHKEIFKAIHEGALIKHDSCFTSNYWIEGNAIEDFEISYDFGETFEPMEVEE